MLLLRASRPFALRSSRSPGRHARLVSTLPNNRNVYVHPTTSQSSPHDTYTLTLTPTSPPHPHLALGTTTAIPVTPRSFSENPHFLKLVHSVLRTHAIHDPTVRGAAAAYASTAGATLGSGGAGFIAGGGGSSGAGGLPPNHPAAQAARQAAKRARPSNIPGSARSPTTPSPSPSSTPYSAYGGGGGAGGDGAGGASAQGGAGGGGRGGWVHVSDERRAPEYGRIAWPEDIFGSVEVDGKGEFVGEGGNYQESGTYRIVTNEGVLGLSGYLMEKVRAAVEELEKHGVGR
ncbi:uncharacterized protein J3D65DRAFT_630228 [Phyllosticta citribraziliensis]|uniref:Uncharacterized protein n=1 Tax=Phyllosticta citribraziliensis TaxID=989973 RepID=A0ABR1LN32_9PEZI